MKVAIINASPKIKNSNSALVLSDLKYYLKEKCEICDTNLNFKSDFQSVLDEIKTYDVWVFAFPLYVDNMPSHLLKFLEFLYDKTEIIGKKYIYAIANCGFYEAIQTKYAINAVRFWCNKSNHFYGGGVGVGGGEAFEDLKSIPIGYGPKASIDKALSALAQAMIEKNTIDDQFKNLNYPRFLYKIGATGRWRKLIKQNGGKFRDLGNRPKE